MTEHLESESHPPNGLLIPKPIIKTDGLTNGAHNSPAYESDNENENPILLELGVTSSVTNTTSELTTVSYASEYNLSKHLNNVFGTTTPHSIYNIDATLLYNNPYNNVISTNAHQLPVHSPQALTTRINTTSSPVPYTSHIPQTVYTWSTPTPVSSVTCNKNLNGKLTTEIVPPPVYMSYPNARDQIIMKEVNPSWKEKALQCEKDYKKTACDRERTRMRDMNRAFDLLRSKLPISKPNGKKYSKIESLRIAINYINHLQQTLKCNDDQNGQSMDNYTKSNQNAVEYLSGLSLRQRTHSHHYESNEKLSPFVEAHDKPENFDETRSTWSDGYIPNSQDKWE